MASAALAAVLAATVSAEPASFLLGPDLHGDRVAFTREGDIWIGDLTTGKASRLTRFEGAETRPRFSPDGTMLAFQAQYEGGGTQVYVLPVEGGIPRRVTSRLNAAQLDDWTPDGRKLLCRGPGAFFVPQPFLVPVAGGPEEPLPLEKMGMGQIGPNNQLAFCRFGDIAGGAWFRYVGGSRNDIWLGDLNTRSFKRVFTSKTQAQYPVWVGDRIFFIHETDRVWTLTSVAGTGGGAKKHTPATDDLVYDLQTDGKRLIYVKGTGLEIFDPATEKALPVKLDMTSDRIHMRPIRVDAAGFVSNYSITPTGKRLLVESRGQVLSVPVREGEVRLWKSMPGVRIKLATMSPDGKSVAYVSDESREQQVMICDADGSNPRTITKDGNRQIDSITWSPTNDWLAIADSDAEIRLVKADGSVDRTVSTARREISGLAHAFSPDGKWLAYVEQTPWTNQQVSSIHVQEVATGKSTQVTSGRFRDAAPTFSTDGRFLAFTTVRSVPMAYDEVFSQFQSSPTASVALLPLSPSTASPFRARNDEEGTPPPPGEAPAAGAPDWAGAERRMIMVPGLSGQINQVAVVGDRIVYSAGGTIGFYDLSTRSGGTLTTGFGFAVSADGKSLLLSGMRVVPVAGRDLPPNAGTVSLQGFKLDIDPAKEWEQIFWEAWRYSRDYFYVKNMHGNDWKAIGDRYAALLPQVRARNELTELLRWMQAELSVGHSFRQEPNIFLAPAASTPAYLGAETTGANGYHRITRLYDGDGFMPASPLLEPGLGIGVGTYILAVNGKPTTDRIDYRELLRDRGGQVVSLTVNSQPVTAGARTVYVRPHSAGVERALLERDVVKQRREYVDKQSGGKVGYIYLSGMVETDMESFALQYIGQLGKEALILDIRENNGGLISATIVSILRKETYLRRSQRSAQEASTRFHDAFEGHLCLVINEDSYSDGEGGPANWRYAKLGPIIGSRTYGALVGSAPGWPFLDGGSMQVPRYGNWRDDEGWVVEGPGVAPDIDVENDPNLYAKGQDPQLDRAIKEMMDRVTKSPIKRPVQPKDPIKSSKGGG